MRYAVRLLVWLWLLVPVAAAAEGVFPLSIVSAGGQTHLFEVEIARTDAEKQHGLMDRSSMPADHGMLFPFDDERQIYMWMKDTLIPLDMVFIDHTGRITGIAARAVPMSEIVIPSPGPVLAVLELNGGTAERLGIAIGDTVRFPAVFRP